MRCDGETAKIELPPEQIKGFMEKINLGELVSRFQELGFIYVTLDLEGYRSGKLNPKIS